MAQILRTLDILMVSMTLAITQKKIDGLELRKQL